MPIYEFSCEVCGAHLVKSPGERRRQEGRNATLRESARASFKRGRQWPRDARSKGGDR